MLNRAFLFAAFVALAAAQDVDEDTNLVEMCAVCGDVWNCCSADSTMKSVDGVFMCIQDSESCTLCEDCPADEGNTVAMGVEGATSSGGVSVGAFLQNGMKGFEDVPNSRFSNFPRFMRASRALVFDKSTKANWYTALKCQRPPCDVFVFAYRTQRCTSEGEDEMHDYMHSKDFLPNSCGPTFQLTPEGHEHQFTTYHKELLQMGDEVVIAPGVPLDFAFIAIGSKRHSCAEYDTDAAGCQSLSACTYNVGEKKCETRWCESEKCAVCPKLENGAVNYDDIPRSG